MGYPFALPSPQKNGPASCVSIDGAMMA